jgi:hypothetical protein
MKIGLTGLMVLSLMLPVVAGCGLFSSKTWRNLYSGSPLIFSVPQDSSNAVWERARTWFGGAPLRPNLAIANDTLLRSAATRAGAGEYILSVVRTADGEDATFVVSYTIVKGEESGTLLDRAVDRAEELAYMAATSDTPQAHLQRMGRNEADPIYDWKHP